MEKVRVDLGARSYDILIGNQILSTVGEQLEKLDIGSKILIISNDLVYGLYGEEVRRSLVTSGFKVEVAKIPDGEQYKSLETAKGLYDSAVEFELDRESSILALGGGVVGDIAGFIAATFMRGINFIQVPTTVLAQVDSSVGGKVAVNHPQGKNLIGDFYQPKLVIADSNVLSTLEDRELKAGISEIIKYGVIWDEEFFAFLEANYEDVLNLEPVAIHKAIKRSCQIKAKVVAEDETEQGLRAILNYGHTVGHAIEAVTDYNQYRHGEAIAIGMVAAACLAEKMELLATEAKVRQKNLIANFSLPTSCSSLKVSDLISAMSKDKKAKEGDIYFILAKAIGDVFITADVEPKQLEEALIEVGGEL